MTVATAFPPYNRTRFDRISGRLVLAALLVLAGCNARSRVFQPPTKLPAPPSAAAAALPTPIEKDGAWGYADRRGQVVIPARYQLAGAFSETGIAWVLDDAGWAYIDRQGRVLVRPMVYDNGPDPFSEGLARYVADGRYGFFDPAGHIVIPAHFDFAQPFHQGRAAVCMDCEKREMGEHWTMVGGRWGYIDGTGELVIPLRFDRVKSFSEGHARVWMKGAEHVIDREGGLLD